MIWITYVTMALLLVIGIFLIFIVLLQRGRGGGLAGALGGMGGQSAFGTKAGDLFTRITVVLAVIWIVLCAGQIPLLRAVNKKFKPGSGSGATIMKAGDKDAEKNSRDDDDAAKDAAVKTLTGEDGEKQPAEKELEGGADKKDEKSELDSKDDKPDEKPKTDEKAAPKSDSEPEPKSDDKPQE